MRDSAFSPEAIPALVREATAAYLERFRHAGFVPEEPVDLVTTTDPTLLFINSTIAPYKERVRSGTFPNPGIVSAQPCFRANDLGDVFDPDADPAYHSSFVMLGALAKPDRAEILYRTLLEYLTVSAGIDTDRLLVRSHSRLRDVNAVLAGGSVPTSLDGRPDSYYAWKYGMDDVSGEGATLAVRVGSAFEDIGNIIRVVDASGTCLGWELGFGAEVLLARKFGRHVFELLPLCAVLPYRDTSAFRKLSDCLMSSVELLACGLEPAHNRHGYVLKKLLKGLFRLARESGVDEAALHEVARNYAAIQGHRLPVADLLRAHLQKHAVQHERNVSAFRKYLRTHAGLPRDELLRVAYDTFSLLPLEAEPLLQ